MKTVATRWRGEGRRHTRGPSIRWSTALLLAVTLPAAAIAQTREGAATGQSGLFPEPAVIGHAIDAGTRIATSGDGGDIKNGFYPELGNMVTGAGWISGGPGYRQWLFHDRAFLDVSTAVSWRAYKMAQARFELPRLARSRLTAGTQVRWQDLTQVSYFGEGPASLEANRSEYRLRSANVVGYSVYRPTPWLAIDGRVGWLTRPDLDAPAGTFKRGNPATADVFGDDPVFRLGTQPRYLHSEASITRDTRDVRGYPAAGGVYRATVARYVDRDAHQFTFTRYEAEAARFVPVKAAHTVFALHAWLVGTHTGPEQLVPFYLMPSLGGANTMRGYGDYRFHDRALLLVNAEARLALFTHVDAALFVDAGNVAPRVSDLNLDRASYGAGIRLHARRATFARLDVAYGEGWRFVFRMNDPFRLGRLSRRTAAAPFVP
jgi:hypothetical protein